MVAFTRHKLSDGSYESCSFAGCGNYLLDEKDVFPLRRVRFGNFFINVSNAFQYQLDEKFGKEWSNKVKKYNHSETFSPGEDFLKVSDFLPLGPFGPLKNREKAINNITEKSFYNGLTEKPIRDNRLKRFSHCGNAKKKDFDLRAFVCRPK